jgi:AcrR family transcriptional regulator
MVRRPFLVAAAPGVSYSYADAARDRICRPVTFVPYDGVLLWRTARSSSSPPWPKRSAAREAGRRYRTAISLELADGLPRIEVDKRRQTVRGEAEAFVPVAADVAPAVDLHRTVGPARTTITAVAQRAGVQRHTVYRHFPTEDDLFAACSGHFFAAHPWPDPAAWRTVADPAERLTAALDELYAYYERAAGMLTNVLRDAALVAAVERTLAPFRAFVGEAARTLGAGWGARGRRRTVVAAAARHAVDFATWRSLAGDGGVRRAHAVELTAAMVLRAAGR